MKTLLTMVLLGIAAMIFSPPAHAQAPDRKEPRKIQTQNEKEIADLIQKLETMIQRQTEISTVLNDRRMSMSGSLRWLFDMRKKDNLGKPIG